MAEQDFKPQIVMRRKRGDKETEAIVCLLTLIIYGDTELVKENFDISTREQAAQLWQELDEKGYKTTQEKYNALLDLLLEKSSIYEPSPIEEIMKYSYVNDEIP